MMHIYSCRLAISLTIYFCFLGIHLPAQFVENVQNSLGETGSPKVRIDTRNSFITNRFMKVMGVKLGWNHNEVFEYGLSYSWLAGNLLKPMLFSLTPQQQDTVVMAKARLRYLSVYAEYTFYNKGRWRISIPVMLGGGRIKWLPDTPLDGWTLTKGRPVLLYEAAMVWVYKPLKFLEIGAGGGYRINLLGKKNSGIPLSSPLYVIKINLLPRAFFRNK